MTTLTKEELKKVYKLLQDRSIHPSGDFDKAGRFYAKHKHLIDVREPSRSYPFSHMTACRTLKYVTKVAEFFGCTSVEQLIDNI